MDWIDFTCGHHWSHGERPAEDDAGTTPNGGSGEGEEATPTWDGDRVNVIWLEPNEQTVQDLGTYTISANVDRIATPSPVLHLYVGTSAIGLVNTSNTVIGFEAGTEFAGFKFTDLSGGPIASVEVNDVSTIEVLPGALVYGDNFVQLNLLDTVIPPLGILSLNISFD